MFRSARTAGEALLATLRDHNKPDTVDDEPVSPTPRRPRRRHL
jgi:hypothetical protein